MADASRVAAAPRGVQSRDQSRERDTAVEHDLTAGLLRTAPEECGLAPDGRAIRHSDTRAVVTCIAFGCKLALWVARRQRSSGGVQTGRGQSGNCLRPREGCNGVIGSSAPGSLSSSDIRHTLRLQSRNSRRHKSPSPGLLVLQDQDNAAGPFRLVRRYPRGNGREQHSRRCHWRHQKD